MSLPGRFLSRRCLTLCIIMEVEPRIAKHYKCHHCCRKHGGWVEEQSIQLLEFSCTNTLDSIVHLSRRYSERVKNGIITATAVQFQGIGFI